MNDLIDVKCQSTTWPSSSIPSLPITEILMPVHYIITKRLFDMTNKYAASIKSIRPDSARGRLLLFNFILMMSIFSIQRLIIYLSMSERFAEIHLIEIAKSFAYGFRFDLVITCMSLAPLAFSFALIPAKYSRHKYVSIPTSIYCGFIYSLILFLSIADYYFFCEFGERLNNKVFAYIGYDYIYKIIMEQYPYISAIVISIMVFLVTSWFTYKHISIKRDYVAGTLANITWSLLALSAMILGIRGSVGPKAINTGPAYFSSSNQLAQLTLNGLFTLREAASSILTRRVVLEDRFNLLPPEEALSTTRRLLQVPQDSFSNRTDNPLWRNTSNGAKHKNYNVVVIIMESLAWPYVKSMGGMANLTPSLEELIKHGILMDHCFSVGHRTTYAFSGVVCGFPDLPGKSITTREESVGNFLTLGSVLSRRGYETIFVYGGQPYYDHRQSFLGSNGFHNFIFEDNFPQKTFRTHLGWCDEDMFKAANQAFMNEQKPFFAVLMTVAFHRDYVTPKGKVKLDDPDRPYRKQRLAVKYADWAIGQYIKEAKKSQYFDNTIFVFVADHCGGYLNPEPKPTAFRVPFLIYAPAVIGNKGVRNTQVCSQTDIAPTIMSLLGGSYSHSFFGSSVLDRDPSKGRALIEPGDGTLAYIDGSENMIVLSPHNNKATLFSFKYPDDILMIDSSAAQSRQTSKRLQKEAIAILQTADILYQNQSYQYR